MIILEPLCQLPLHSVCHACHSPKGLTKMTLVKAFGPTVLGWNTLIQRRVNLYVRGVRWHVLYCIQASIEAIQFPDILLLICSKIRVFKSWLVKNQPFPKGLCAWMEVIHMNSKVKLHHLCIQPGHRCQMNLSPTQGGMGRTQTRQARDTYMFDRTCLPSKVL